MDIEGVSHPLVPGDVLIIPPNTKHYAKLLDNSIPYRRFVFWISQDYCNKLFNISSDYVYLIQRVHTTKQYLYHYDIIGFNTLQSKIFRLIEEMHANRFGKQTKVQLCLKDLVFHFNRSIYEMEQKNKKYEENALYENILLYIEDHIDEDLTICLKYSMSVNTIFHMYLKQILVFLYINSSQKNVFAYAKTQYRFIQI